MEADEEKQYSELEKTPEFARVLEMWKMKIKLRSDNPNTDLPPKGDHSDRRKFHDGSLKAELGHAIAEVKTHQKALGSLGSQVDKVEVDSQQLSDILDCLKISVNEINDWKAKDASAVKHISELTHCLHLAMVETNDWKVKEASSAQQLAISKQENIDLREALQAASEELVS